MQNKLKEEGKRLLKSGSKSTCLNGCAFSGLVFSALENLTCIFYLFFQKVIFSQLLYQYHFNSGA